VGRLSTNPLSFAIPTDGHPIVVDMTTTVVAEGKVRVKRNRGEPCPEGWITDAQGNPTTDPNAFYGPPRGCILPFGGIVGHKGFALGLVVEVLSGILSGAGYANEAAKRLSNGVWMLGMNISDFVDPATFRAHVNDLVRYLKTAPLAPGFTEILMPGEPEYRQIEKRKQEGIFIDDETWRQLTELAASVS
ncbi:MAG: Ldh family oxidoreductase, partial [Abditibacteriales bacterium]|nr:Ldh family oxidoreductase [Abditibacteriales bacterium]